MAASQRRVMPCAQMYAAGHGTGCALQGQGDHPHTYSSKKLLFSFLTDITIQRQEVSSATLGNRSNIVFPSLPAR